MRSSQGAWLRSDSPEGGVSAASGMSQKIVQVVGRFPRAQPPSALSSFLVPNLPNSEEAQGVKQGVKQGELRIRPSF